MAVTIDTSIFKLKNVCLMSVKCQAHENTQFLRQQPITPHYEPNVSESEILNIIRSTADWDVKNQPRRWEPEKAANRRVLIEIFQTALEAGMVCKGK